MQITLTNTGKRYNREWIFRYLDYNFLPAKSYAITGPNGSGKSTLLQVIAGAVMQSEGKIDYLGNGHTITKSASNDATKKNQVSTIIKPIPAIDVHKHLAFSAPYLELVEEMTATELLNFHTVFKHFIKPIPEILIEVNLEKSANKQIRYFSSGMKQRLKLAQAFFGNTSVLLLDEPLTNLDEDGIAMYHRLINNYARDKMVIVSSNDKQEYDFCEEIIPIGKYNETSVFYTNYHYTNLRNLQ